MKYMTPELYAVQDDSADDAWEDNLRAYRQHLSEIELPESVRKFMAWGSLHDAHFDVPAAVIGAADFQLVLQQLDYGPEQRHYAILTYKAVDVRTCQHNQPVFARAQGAEHTYWLYDEFDMQLPAQGGKPAVYQHSILLSSGVVVQIFFTDFHFIILPVTKDTVEA